MDLKLDRLLNLLSLLPKNIIYPYDLNQVENNIIEENGTGSNFNLRNINNNLPFDIIHITGTNGKGSTVSIIEKCFMGIFKYLNPKKIKSLDRTSSNIPFVGKFISPHLIVPDDSIQINSVPIHLSFPKTLKWSQDLIEDTLLKISSDFIPSSFEILFCKCLLIFTVLNVDLAIIEVGLGGRLDATNVILNEILINSNKKIYEPLLICGFTSIDLDHEFILGDTIEKITIEKSGILKKNCYLALSKDLNPVSLKIIKDKYLLLNPLLSDEIRQVDILPLNDGSNSESIEYDSIFTGQSYQTEINLYDNLSFKLKGFMKLNGLYQLGNLSVALGTVEILLSYWLKTNLISKNDLINMELNNILINSISKANNKGRLEYFKASNDDLIKLKSIDDINFKLANNESIILIDGAHNPHASLNVKKYIESKVIPYIVKNTNISKNIYVIIAITSNKEAKVILSNLLLFNKLSNNSKVQIFPIFIQFTIPLNMNWIVPNTTLNLYTNLNSMINDLKVNQSLDKYLNLNFDIINKLIKNDQSIYLIDAFDIIKEHIASNQNEFNSNFIVMVGSLYLVSDFYKLL